MSSPFRFVAAFGLAATACLPLSAEVLVREDFTGYVGAGLLDMPVAPGTGFEGGFKVTLASQGIRVEPNDTARYRWGSSGDQEFVTALVRAVNAYQRPRLQATINQLSGKGGAITGRTMWFRFLVQFPVRNPGPKASDPTQKVADPGVVLMLSERPPFVVGVRNDQAGPGATLVVGEAWSQKFQLPAETTQPICVIGRLQWGEGAYRALEVWLNPRADKDRLTAEIAAPVQSLAPLKLVRIGSVTFQWSPLSTSKGAQLPGLGAVALAENLADLMPGVTEPPPAVPGP